MWKFRYSCTLKQTLDYIDDILIKIEELCPFGTMIKMLYQLDKVKDVWFTPNRKEVEPGAVRLRNLMNFFHKKARLLGQPMMVKNIFETEYDEYTGHLVYTVGQIPERVSTLSELWFSALNQVSWMTDSNLSKVPWEKYKWDLYCFPITPNSKDMFQKAAMRMKTRIDDEEEISISSIASMDEDRKAKVNNAMMMVFYCSRKSFE
jgi:hypothetical protein